MTTMNAGSDTTRTGRFLHLLSHETFGWDLGPFERDGLFSGLITGSIDGAVFFGGNFEDFFFGLGRRVEIMMMIIIDLPNKFS